MARTDAVRAFFRVWGGLPQAGPGSDESTRRALEHLPALPDAPRILDMGCGPGRQTLALARALPHARIIAVDVYEPFLDRLTRRATEEGLADQIEPRLRSMDAVGERAGSADLIWSEGAAYVIGVGRALLLWRVQLKPGGLLAFTELAWLTDDRPEEARNFMQVEYPSMTDVAGNLALAESSGYQVLEHFVLPASDWWDNFYGPLEERVAELRPEATADSLLASVLDQAEREIQIFRAHGDSYGYVFFLLRADG